MTVAVLGAGLLGVCAALEIAERGVPVHVFERNDSPLAEASYWTEAKLHLGFVYAADPSRRTAVQMLRGAFSFGDSLSRWIDRKTLESLLSPGFDYLVHRDTLVPPDAVERHFASVAELFAEVRGHAGGDYPGYDGGPLYRRLTASEIAERYNPSVVLDGYATEERGIDSWVVAAHLRSALAAHPRITLRTGCRVVGVNDTESGFQVELGGEPRRRDGPYRSVVNALWANRLLIDARRGRHPGRRWLNRFKLGVNYRIDPQRSCVPTMTLLLGRFGDTVFYPTGRAYISWYPAGMIGMESRLQEFVWPEILGGADLAAVRRDTVDALAAICPAVAELDAGALEPPITDGGAIFAWGETDIDDPNSVLHQRFAVGVHSDGAYHTVDTGKYTLGPMFAQEVADRIVPRVAIGAA